MLPYVKVDSQWNLLYDLGAPTQSSCDNSEGGDGKGGGR